MILANNGRAPGEIRQTDEKLKELEGKGPEKKETKKEQPNIVRIISDSLP